MIQQSNADVVQQSSPANVDLTRVRYGAGLVAAAFVLLGVIFGIAVAKFNVPADVATVVGSVATGVGTIVGAYFGLQVGSSGKEVAEAGRAQAERVARMALAKLDPREADEVMRYL
jgi:tetrahydromethanopterin S-methyltransferase subunit C